MKTYLHDYVWMVPPDGGAPEKVTTAVDEEGSEIARKMFKGWVQCEPPAEKGEV
jgi:hypothetical protein